MYLKKLVKRSRFLTESFYKQYHIDPLKYLIGMTSLEERNFWQQYTKDNYRGIGEVVDLGSWFGSTTVPLIRGLLQNPNFKNSHRKLYAYDMFVWEEWMIPYIQHTKWKDKFLPGDDFLPAFKDVVLPYRKYIHVVKADLTQSSWIEKPIEFLLVDAMKSWELLNAIQSIFYPFLIPGKSVVVHQDFSHYYTYWIHLLQYRFRNYFEFMQDISGGSAVFLYQKKIPAEMLQKKYTVKDFSAEEIDNAFDFSLSLVSDVHKGNVEAARVMCYNDFYGEDKAQQKLTEILDTGLRNADLNTAASLIGYTEKLPS